MQVLRNGHVGKKGFDDTASAALITTTVLIVVYPCKFFFVPGRGAIRRSTPGKAMFDGFWAVKRRFCCRRAVVRGQGEKAAILDIPTPIRYR
ncbi:hypothetical protein CR511_15880 [Pseudomonas putida]|nr:hypothetical protein CR511_15880 [Pseudomonas putida]